MGRIVNDIHAGQVWRDRDRRMMSGNRRVRVTRTVRDGDKVSVYYRQVVGWTNTMVGSELRSRYDRFQRAFDLVS